MSYGVILIPEPTVTIKMLNDILVEFYEGEPLEEFITVKANPFRIEMDVNEAYDFRATLAMHGITCTIRSDLE